ENAPRATPEVIDRAFTRIGRQFDDLAARNRMRIDQPLQTEIRTILQEYDAAVPASARSPMVGGLANDILGSGRNPLPGRNYQSWRSRLDRAARGTNDPELKRTFFDMRNALDDAMERSMAN